MEELLELREEAEAQPRMDLIAEENREKWEDDVGSLL